MEQSIFFYYKNKLKEGSSEKVNSGRYYKCLQL